MMRRADGARRVRRSGEQWSRLIEEHARSGLSQRAFCEAHGLGYSSFTKARASHRVPDVVERSNEASEFVPIAVETVNDERWAVEIQLGPAMFVRVRGG